MGRLDTALADLRALDSLAARDTGLARRDPRAKWLVTLAFVVTVLSFDRYTVAAMLPLALYPTVLAAQAEVPAAMLRRWLWLASPLVLMVGLFNPWFDRQTQITVAGVSISGGWLSLAAIVLRFVLTASAVLLLVASTGMLPLCVAMSRLGVPRAFTTQLLFLHRYSFVLTGEASRLATARRLRAGDRPGRAMVLAEYASMLGQLLLRSFDRAGRVHQAMLARGFDGDLRLADRWHWQPADTWFTLGWGAFFAASRWLDVPQTLGSLLVA
jgi:cobalt/nickel transport system permease protein